MPLSLVQVRGIQVARGLLFSASFTQAPEMRLLMPLSLVQVRGIQVAREEERHSVKSRCEKVCRTNDTSFVAEPTVLSSRQSMPMAKESGAKTQP